MGQDPVSSNFIPVNQIKDSVSLEAEPQSGVYFSTSQLEAAVVTVAQDTPIGPTQANASLVISNTDTSVASTKTITKTIGATSYVKTISYNAAGDVIIVSKWV